MFSFFEPKVNYFEIQRFLLIFDLIISIKRMLIKLADKTNSCESQQAKNEICALY